MSVRLPACDPCRVAKLACDHKQPACTRCWSRGQRDACVYRARPFKRRRTDHELQEPTNPVLDKPTNAPPSPVLSRPQKHHYPNPGFLGSSSHSVLFDHVSSSANPIDFDSSYDDLSLAQMSCPSEDLLRNQTIVEKGAHALNRLDHTVVSKLKMIVDAWLEKGVNLPLAEPFVARSAQTVHDMVVQLISRDASTLNSNTWASQCSKTLLLNTQKPLTLYRELTVTDFFAQMLGENTRWETAGIFFAAASRAILDTPYFPMLFRNEEQRRKLVRLLTHIGDSCLESCLELDCLNGLQLVLQYENFIVHSQVYGDQSYHSWRRMGDLASSLYALGYHERIDEETSQVPDFIIELRKAAFSRIYAADKNLAIFLGRPPRIIKAYCNFQLPSNLPGLWDINTAADDSRAQLSHEVSNREADQNNPKQTAMINYTADTRCSAIFATLKEDILELFRDPNNSNNLEKSSSIRADAEKQWQMLPNNFKLATSLQDCQRDPFERDFLAGTQLDYLHTLFLLHLVSLRQLSEPDELLLRIASDMLSLVVQVIVLRDRLVNSGTCLIWKVAHFGLPAAGIVSLALLNPSFNNNNETSLRSRMLQDLSVLVVEVRLGAVIHAGEPNFALFTRATRTIQSLLDTVMVPVSQRELPQSVPTTPQQQLNFESTENWDPWVNAEPWEFEIDFWANLGKHPSLQVTRQDVRSSGS